MHPAKLKQLEDRLYSQMSLIGGCLRQRAAQALAQDGSPDAVRVLAKAIARSDDRKVLAIALDALRQVKKQQCIDEVCAVWSITRHQDLASLLVKKNWVAAAPVDVKVLTALKVGQTEATAKSGKEIVEPLLQAISDVDPEIASRASQCASAIANPDVVDDLCQRWSKTRDRLIEQVILQGKYIARQPAEVRVLSALKVERLEVVKNGGKEVVDPLIMALSDTEREISHRANQCIAALKNPDAIDNLCQRWVQTRNTVIGQAIVQQGYVARQPIQVRVLSALKAGQRSLVIEGKTEIVEPLLNAFSDADREIANCAKQCANALINPDAIDYLCGKWASSRDKLLEQVILQGSYVARQPMEVRVLTALKTGKGQIIAPDEARIITLLLQAYKDVDSKIASEATAMLDKLQNQATIDVLCSEWAKTRAKQLTEALQSGQYVAASPIEVRVLSALKVGKLEAVINGGTEVVELLLQACKDIDSDIAKSGQLALRKLKNSEAQEFLCNLVIEQDHQLAREVVVDCQYKPRDSRQLAIFYFVTEQWDKYESLDFEHALLQTAYEIGDKQLRQRIAQKVRQAGRAEWVHIIAGGHKGKRLGEMTHDEWETALEILNSGRKWEEMWQLAQVAPPIWSVRLLRQLKDARWVPKTEFAKLVQMGQGCVVDVPDRLNNSWRYQSMPLGHSIIFASPIISLDSKLLVSHENGIIRLWSLPDGKLLQTLTEHSDHVDCLAISPDGKLLVGGSCNGPVRLWSLPDGKLLQTLTEYQFVSRLAISPDGKLLASISCGRVRLCSLPDGKLLQTLTEHSDHVNCLAISSDGKLLAGGSRDRTVKLWNLPDGKLLQTLAEHGDSVSCLAISLDGKLLASGSICESPVRLWSLPDGKLLQTLTEHSDKLCCLAISPDGRLLASGSRDRTVKLWNLPDGKLLQTLAEHSDHVDCLAISPDGKLLASGSRDRTVKLWNLPDGKLLQTLAEHSSGVTFLTISPDGKILVSGGWWQTIRLWSSGLDQLSRLPVKHMTMEDMQWVQETLQNKNISEAERDWLKFIQALISWRRRFDVEVEEAPQLIDAGEFDIEIEG